MRTRLWLAVSSYIVIVSGCANTQQMLVYHLDKPFYTQLQDAASLSHLRNVISQSQLERLKKDETRDGNLYSEVYTAIVRELGVSFPEGTYLRIDTRTDTLYFRNTRANCKVFRNLMSPFKPE